MKLLTVKPAHWLVILALTTCTVIQCTSIGEPAVESVKPAKEAPLVGEPTKAASEQPTAKSTGVESAPATKPEVDSQDSSRKGRSEAPPQSSLDKPAAEGKSTAAAAAAATTTSKPAAVASSSSSSSSKPSTSANSKQQASGKSSAAPSSTSGKKLPANLGTVTSTGSGGPAHYMSKHDAYSAIAEKHGALAQDAMHKVSSSSKRQHHGHHNPLQRFGGIQKAGGGLGDMLSPFKGVTDSGLARTLGASVRSIMKGKYSVPAYVASAVLGAVALMAFYESPISPLPVPALPEPPVGRFPPEMPNISPNLQVPFRMNGQGQGQGQQQYGQQQAYQRSSSVAQPQQQQVLFPGATAQQRQMNSAGPVQQISSLISSVGANRATAQRKSSPDYADASSSRSFFGTSNGQQSAGNKLSSQANNNGHKQAAGSSLLSFLGLGGGGGGGGSSASSSSSSGDSPTSAAALASLDIHRASGLGGHQIAAGGGPISSASGTELKPGQSALSNSHLINKMKSYFDRPIGANIWPAEHYAPNQYDQYRRMSIVQALAKDTAFLSSFFTPSRRSSNSSSSAMPMVSANQLQQSISNILSAASGASTTAGGSPAGANNQPNQQARMQVDGGMQQLFAPIQQQSTPIVNTKRASSGYGLMKTADRIARALLDTFTAGLLHRGPASSHDSVAARKSEEDQQRNAIVSATSLLSDIMSSYNAQQQQQQQQQQQNSPAQAVEQQKQPQADLQAKQSPTDQMTSGRSAEQSPAAAPAQAQIQSEQPQGVQQPKQTSQQVAPDSSSAPLTRKTRSIGLEYPTTTGQYHYQLQQQQQQLPSRASQINNLVDMVSDSYKQNKLLFSFVMNQVGLSQAVPYVDQFLNSPNELQQQ